MDYEGIIISVYGGRGKPRKTWAVFRADIMMIPTCQAMLIARLKSSILLFSLVLIY
jgi:hypothetical protein